MEVFMSILQSLLSLEEGFCLAKFCIPLIFYLDSLKIFLKVETLACSLPKDGILLLQRERCLSLQHAGANIVHKEVVVLNLRMPQLHLLLLKPLSHGQLGFDIFDGPLLPVREVNRIQVSLSLSKDRFIKQISEAIEICKL